MNLQYISECCPVGCGSYVVLLKPLNGNPVFCYCDACGLCWGSPEEAQFEKGLQTMKGPADFASSGVSIATLFESKNLNQYILGEIELKYWATSINELNEEIANTKT